MMNEYQSRDVARCEQRLNAEPEWTGFWRSGSYALAHDLDRSELPNEVSVTVTFNVTVAQALELSDAIAELGRKRYVPAFNPYGRVSGLIGRQAYRAMKRAWSLKRDDA